MHRKLSLHYSLLLFVTNYFDNKIKTPHKQVKTQLRKIV